MALLSIFRIYLWQIFRYMALMALLLTMNADSFKFGQAPALTRLPPKILWAWERREDMRWLPAGVGVAYVYTAIGMNRDRVTLHPRVYPLQVPPDTPLIPVVHVDPSWHHPPVLNDIQRNTIVDQVLRAAGIAGANVVQLDFEARLSQRQFYLDTVKAIRRKLPADKALSVTALASWCDGDYWLENAQVDEIVPMVFRMAQDDVVIRGMLAERRAFPRERCRAAVGFSSDEPIPYVQADRQYYFSPVPWSEDAWRKLNEKETNQSLVFK